MRLVAYLAVAYLAIVAFLYFMQAKLIFPASNECEKVTPADSGLAFEDLHIPVAGRDHLHAWWVPAASPSKSAMLVFHGNGYVLEDMVGGELETLHQIGANLLLVDYRGYGSSSAITPSEKTIKADADAALNYLLNERNISKRRIFLFGRSIGSGPAAYLAATSSGLAGLILASPLSSLDDISVAVWYTRLFPVSLLLQTHFNTLSRIKRLQLPLLIVSGAADTLTPVRMASVIFEAAHQPKQIYFVPKAGHDDLLTEGGAKLVQVLRRFMEENR